jgi:hypothetical protein
MALPLLVMPEVSNFHSRVNPAQATIFRECMQRQGMKRAPKPNDATGRALTGA